MIAKSTGVLEAARGRDPAPLAASLESDPSKPGARERPGRHYCSDSIVSEQREILSVLAAGTAGSTLIVNEGSNSLCGQHPLQRVVVEGRVLLGSVNQHDDRYPCHRQAASRACRQESCRGSRT